MRSARTRATRGCITRRIAARHGPWLVSQMETDSTCKGQTTPLRNPMAMRRLLWFGIRCGSLFVAAVRYHGYYQSTRWRDVDAARRTTGCGSHVRSLPGQSRDDWIARLSDFSRNTCRESSDGRHVCLDGGRQQSGPGDLAGSVRTQWRRLLKPEHHIRQAMEHVGAGDERSATWARPQSKTAITTWRWPRCLPDRTRCCWPAPTTFGSAVWR